MAIIIISEIVVYFSIFFVLESNKFTFKCLFFKMLYKGDPTNMLFPIIVISLCYKFI